MWFQLLDNGMHYTLFLFISSITVIFYYTLYNTLYSIINQEKKKLLLHLTEKYIFFLRNTWNRNMIADNMTK